MPKISSSVVTISNHKRKIRLVATTNNKQDAIPTCKSCQHHHPPTTTTDNNKKVMNATAFNSIMYKRIRTLSRKKTTVDQIRDNLIRRYPDQKKYITMSAIKSCIKMEYTFTPPPAPINEEEIKIEFENSIFIDEAMVLFNNHQQVHLMCAISSKGLEKLDISLEKRHCSQNFTSSVLNMLENEPFQIIMKSSVDDIQEIEKLFQGRSSLHTLFFYPRYCSVTNPVRKYIAKLATFLPKQTEKLNHDVESVFGDAVKNVSKKDCKRWIERYLNSC